MDISVAISECTGADAIPVMDAIARLLAQAGAHAEFLLLSDDADRKRPDAPSVPDSIGPFPLRIIETRSVAYGDHVRAFRDACRGAWLVTLDNPTPDDAALVFGFWNRRHQGDLLVASRYVTGGSREMSWMRTLLSRSLNWLYRWGLAVPVHDLSNGRRMYRTALLRQVRLDGNDYEVLMEALLRFMALGARVQEVPWHFESRKSRHAPGTTLRLVRRSLATFRDMHSLRNSVDFPDYDSRAYDSRIWLQRYWQRKRFRVIREFSRDGRATLDAGCGSSRIITTRPDMFALDINFHRLRFLRDSNPRRVQATAGALPFPDSAFDTVISSQVIEHTRETTCISEMVRVLRDRGRLIVGTPDYATFWWPITERIYGLVKSGGYADEHVTHYTRQSLTAQLERAGCDIVDYRYIGGGELIMLARKRPSHKP